MLRKGNKTVAAEIYKNEDHTIEKINKAKSWFFDGTKKIDKLLVRLN